MEKQTPKSKIQFKPVHEGLGFHPFSDGLPYAPASKATQPATSTTPTTGFGATAGGRPQFATQNSPRPLSQSMSNAMATPLPMRSHSMTQIETKPLAAPKMSKPQMTKAQPAAQAGLQSSLEMAPETATESQIIRRRAFAYILDTVVHAGFWLMTNLVALFFFNFQIDAEIFSENILHFVAFFAISQWLFIALQEMLFETTLGKVFFNLEFKRNHSSLLLRSFVFVMGIAFFGLGFFVRPQDKLGQVTLKSKIES